jgi:hypothetical protein
MIFIEGGHVVSKNRKFILVISIFVCITFFVGCKAKAEPESQDSAIPETNDNVGSETSEPQITRDEIFAVLNNQDSSLAKRTFEFETAAYSAKGNWIGAGKYEVGIRGNGTIALTLSSSRNVVINQTEKRISIAFGQTTVEATTEPPDKWTYFAANDDDQAKVDKKRDEFIEAFEKKAGDTGWDKETIAALAGEITDQRDTKAFEEKKAFEDNIRNAVTNQLMQRYQISDYIVEIFFD